MIVDVEIAPKYNQEYFNTHLTKPGVTLIVRNSKNEIGGDCGVSIQWPCFGHSLQHPRHSE